MRLITPQEYIDDLYDGIDFPLDKNRLELISKLMTDYAKYYHRQQVKSVDLADVVVALPPDEFLDEAAINFCKEHYPDSDDVTKETEVFDAGAIWMRKRLQH